MSRKQIKSLYAQTLANLTKLHDAAKHPEARQAITESKLAIAGACHQECGEYQHEQDN